MDLTTIIQQAALLNNSQTAQAQQISDLMAGASKEASGAAKNLEQAGQLARDVEFTKLQGELNTQNARVKVANSFGTNVNAQSDIITSMGASMREDAIKLVEQQNRVSQIEANSDLISNPLGWLTDLLHGDDARAQRDALAASFDTKSKLVQNLNAATQTSVATQNAISETLTQTSIKQAAQLKVLDANNQAAQARIEAAKYGASSIEALQTVGAQNFSRQMQVYNAVEENARWQESKRAMLEQRAEKKEINDDVNDMVDRINAYRQTFSLPSVNAAYVKRNWGSGKVGDMLRDQELAGWRIIDNNGSTEGALGTKPSDAYFQIKSNDITPPPAWKPSISILEKSEAMFRDQMSQLDPQTGKSRSASMKPEEAQAAFDSIVTATAQEFQKRIRPDDGNPYEAPPIESVLQSPTREAQELKESKFGKLVLQTMVQTGVAKPTPELLMATALSSMEKDGLTLSEVRDGVTTYYREAVGLVNATGGFATMNVPAMTTYRIPNDFLQWRNTTATGENISWWEAPWALQKIAAKTLANKPTKEERDMKRIHEIDLTNSADVTTALTIMQSRKVADKIISNKGSGSE